MKFIGILGVKNKLEKFVKQLCHLFYDSNINTWILSGDCDSSVNNFAHYINLIEIDKKNRVFRLDELEKEGVNAKIKSILFELKSLIDPGRQDFFQIHENNK